MRNRVACFLSILFISSFCALLSAQTADFLPLNMVQPGMKGIGKTVFSGSAIGQFDVEIMGVLRNVAPGQNIILARLSGNEVEEFGVFAGMSGSPVYIDGRLVGAVAYAFNFATSPIAGITPIAEMVDIFREKVPTSFKVARRLSLGDIYEAAVGPHLDAPELHREFNVDALLERPLGMGPLRPILTPFNLSGFSAAGVEAFSGQLQGLGLTPVMGGGSSPQASNEGVNPLQPGSTISVQLVRGDLDISASGTVTHVSGDRVYAFGHPFLGIGFTEMPFTHASVIGIIPTLMNSMKISGGGDFVGTITQDRATGIMGLKGERPSMIPVHLKLHTSRNEVRDSNFEVVTDSFLTPFLITFAVHNSIVSSERAIGGQMLRLKCKIELKDQPDVNFENSVSDLTSSPAVAAVAVASPVYFILNSGFENVELKNINLEIAAVEQTREATLDKVWQDRVEVKPGEEINVTVFLRKSNGEVSAERYPVKIPEGIEPGELKILIGDGDTLTRDDARSDEADFIPQNLGQLVKAINNLKKNDRLYIRLFREGSGAAIGGLGMPDLPPSYLAIYQSARTSGDTRPLSKVVYAEHELPATQFVLSGQKIIQVQVKG